MKTVILCLLDFCLKRFVGGILMVVAGAANAGGVSCSERPEVAVVRLFEYVESPPPNSDQFVRSLFSERLLRSSSGASVAGVIDSARSTYQIGKQNEPLSGRLLGEPRQLPSSSGSFNPRGQATVRLLALSGRGKVEQRMSISCQEGLWRIESLSYGPPE